MLVKSLKIFSIAATITLNAKVILAFFLQNLNCSQVRSPFLYKFFRRFNGSLQTNFLLCLMPGLIINLVIHIWLLLFEYDKNKYCKSCKKPKQRKDVSNASKNVLLEVENKSIQHEYKKLNQGEKENKAKQTVFPA